MLRTIFPLWLASLLWLLSVVGPAYGQPTASPSPRPPLGTPQATPPLPEPLPQLIPLHREPGEIASLHGLTLFSLQSTRDISARDRAELLEKRLEQVLREGKSPTDVKIKHNRHGIYLSCHGIALIGVHDADAEAAQTTPEALAIQWSQILEQRLQRVRQEQSSAFLEHALILSLAALLLALLIDQLLRRLTMRYLQTTGLSVRLLHALLWLTFIFFQFPAMRPLALGLEHYAVRPLLILLLVLFGALVVSYTLRRAILHYFRQLEMSEEDAPPTRPRWRQRLHMLRQVANTVTNSLTTVLAVVVFFSLLEVNLGAMLAGAGFLSVGLGLAAQNILKDWIAGINIVLEDQFGDGDIITADGHEGEVEVFTLRVTQIRDITGNLITIPNSRIQTVKNLSNLWSQADLSIPISYETDVQRALEVMERVARELAAEWPDRLQGEPQILGVDELGSYCLKLRMLQRTAPKEQFPVKRELLLRIKEGLQQEGIELPIQELKIRPTRPLSGD